MTWEQVFGDILRYVVFPLFTGILAKLVADWIDKWLRERSGKEGAGKEARTPRVGRRSAVKSVLVLLATVAALVFILRVLDPTEEYRPRLDEPISSWSSDSTFYLIGHAGKPTEDRFIYVVTKSFDSPGNCWRISDATVLSPDGRWYAIGRDFDHVPLGGRLLVYVFRSPQSGLYDVGKCYVDPPNSGKNRGMSNVVQIQKPLP